MTRSSELNNAVVVASYDFEMTGCLHGDGHVPVAPGGHGARRKDNRPTMRGCER
jgi:hypothetical protein